MCSLALIISCILGAAATDDVELSFDIWDWTAPCKDIILFDTWVADLAAMGFTRIEISVPWRVMEPEPSQIDLRWLEERLAVCKRHKMGMRLRINSYYSGATPKWYEGAFWQAKKGPTGYQNIPAITDEQFWNHYGPICTAIAATCRGADVLFNAFIGVHAELKWADWWHYDEPTMALWRTAIQQPRPAWLQDVVDDAQFGVYKLFLDLGIPTRIICEDNLVEDLSGYRAIFMALSPEALMPRSAREKLAAVSLPRIDDYSNIPPLRNADTPQHATGISTVTITSPDTPIGASDLSGLEGYQYALQAGDIPLAAWRPEHVVLGYPVGLIYQNDPQPYTHQGLLLWALQQVVATN